jgi:hypothetical protein
MRLNKITQLFLLLMIVAFSCQKENNSNSESPPMVDYPLQFSVSNKTFQHSSRFLKREILYNKPTPLFKNIRQFSYDNANRCSEIKIGTIDSAASNPVFVLQQTLSFNYEGTSLLPSSVSSVRTVFPDLVTTFYYNYNSHGLKVRDSVRVKNFAGEPADRVIHYVYESDRVYATPVLTGFSMENITLDTLSILTGGNIEKSVSTTKMSTGDRISTYSFTYDRALNPYNKMNIANSLYFESAALGLGYNVHKETHYMGVTSNNMTSWTSGNYTATYKYVYNQEKYPVRKEMFLPGDTSPTQVIVFEY